MKDQDLSNGKQGGTVVGLPPLASRNRARREGSGIEVCEEELGSIKAQRLYKMRCGCGRSWFELQLQQLVACPACAKMGLVSL